MLRALALKGRRFESWEDITQAVQRATGQQRAFDNQGDQEAIIAPTAAQSEEQCDTAPEEQYDATSEQPTGVAGADVPHAPHAPLATRQHMPVQSGSLAAAKDALAAQRAVDEHGEDAQINPDDFRSIASPLPSSTQPPVDHNQPTPPDLVEDGQDTTR